MAVVGVAVLNIVPSRLPALASVELLVYVLAVQAMMETGKLGHLRP